MKVVWRKDEATVRDVHEALNDTRPVAYTTVMTMMRILEQKGFLTKVAEERAHVYTAAHPRQKVLGAMVRDFVDRVFDGASEGLDPAAAAKARRARNRARKKHGRR